MKNIDKMFKEYSWLINYFAYQLYNQYHQVMDYSDAQQEVRILFWRCLLRQKDNKAKFKTFFTFSFYRMKKRIYYTYKRQINTRNTASDYEFSKVVSKVSNSIDPRIKAIDSEIVDCFLQNYKLNVALVSKHCGISYRTAKKRLDRFKEQIINFV